MRISDWSSDVCSSDLNTRNEAPVALQIFRSLFRIEHDCRVEEAEEDNTKNIEGHIKRRPMGEKLVQFDDEIAPRAFTCHAVSCKLGSRNRHQQQRRGENRRNRSEESRVGKECVSTCRYRGTQYT